MKKHIQIWASKALFPSSSPNHTEPGPVVQCLSAETEAGTETGRGMSLTLLTVPGYSTAPVACFWRVIFQPPGVYLQDTHPSWETHQCHTLAVGRHIAQCWVSEWARQRGWGWRWQTNRESRAALLCVQPCWSSDSLGMKPSRSRHLYPVRDPTRDCTERAIRSSTAGPFEHKLPAPPSFPHSSFHLNTETGWKFNENSVLL